MALQQTISWISLPNGIAPNGNYRLAVFVAPRLTVFGADTPLDAFPDFVDWPATVRELTFTIGNYTGVTASVGSFTTSTPDSAYWKALFPASTRVRSFPFVDRSTRPIYSYPAGSLAGVIDDLYGNTAVHFPDDLPPIDVWANPETGSSYSRPWSQIWNKNREELLDQLAAHIASGQPLPSAPEYQILQALLFQRPRRRTSPPPRLDPVEFHDIVSALGQFPRILRLLGLILDFEIPPSVFFPGGAAVAPGRVWCGPDAWDSPVPTERAIPYTWWKAPFQPLEANPAGDLSDGYLRLGDARFQVNQVDIDGAVDKLASMADTVAAYAAAPLEHGRPGTGLPALRSAGIAITRAGRADQLRASLKRNALLDGQLPFAAVSPIELYAEDLVRGYRLSVHRLGDPQIGAPCLRREQHTLPLADEEHRALDYAAESWLSTGATESDRIPPEIYLQETVARWEGWCLSAPRPGKWIAPLNGAETITDQRASHVGGIPLETRLFPLAGTIPRLRFGDRYAMAVTTADLAGNSTDVLRIGDPAVTRELDYLRYEPVPPPAVVLTAPLDPATAPARPSSGW